MANNRFFILRHGRSRANEKGVICSKLENGVKEEWGLLPGVGEDQARAAGVALARMLESAGLVSPHGPKLQVLFLTSPFSRAKQTAQLAMENLREALPSIQASIEISNDLRERDFGSLELGSDALYEQQWSRDSQGADSLPPGRGESIALVARRMMGVVRQSAARGEAGGDATRVFVLVSHGDPLQVLQAAASQSDVRRHRADHAIGTGELRGLEVRDLGSWEA